MPNKKNIPIKYTSREFESIKQDLVEHAKRYYPDNFNDFSEASFGSMVFDTVAYVGDVLSYYLDYSVNESFLDSAIEFSNVRKHARSMGYKFTGVPVSQGLLAFFVRIPSSSDGNSPDTSYLPILKKGSEFVSNSGVSYTLTEDVNFANQGNDTIGTQFDQNSATTEWAVRAYGQVTSGRSFQASVDLTDATFEKFRKVRVGDSAITEIIDVVDSEGNKFYEVDFLSQETVFVETTNQFAYSEGVRSIMKPFVTARRFTLYQDDTGTYLQFGFGSDDDDDSGLTDPSKVALKMHARDHITHTAIDPTRLLGTDKLGISPQGTTLTITFKRNDGVNPSAAVNTIREVSSVTLVFNNEPSLDATKILSVRNSLECTNEEQLIAPSIDFTTEELRTRSRNFFATQNRAVTKMDYEAIAYNMPNKFGNLKRVNIINNPFATNKVLVMYVVSSNEENHLTKTNTITKQNLKTWLNQYSSINDIIEIHDAKIINFGINFTVMTDNRYDTSNVLFDAIERVKQFYSEKFYIGEPIYINDIFNILSKTEGVIDVKQVKIFNKSSNDSPAYSSIPFVMDDVLSKDATFYKAPKNVVFELKYPDNDIKGKAV